ncbi:MAG: endolytic transglycosylase MltG [Ilumatobacteraceae bacterium]
MTDLDDHPSDPTGEVLRRMAPKRERILHRREPWYDDPWDDPEMCDALAVERPRRSSRKAKLITYTFGLLAVFGVIAAGVVGLWYIGKVNPPGDAGSARSFTVTADDTLQTVSERLQAEGLISDAGVFRWYVDHHDGLELTPGYYQIRPDDHMGNVMLALNTPPSATYQQITFPEGFTIDKMAERLNAKMPRLTVDDFVTTATDGTVTSEYLPEGQTSLEGLLFPDTYQVSNAETSAQIINRMVELMERVGTQERLVARAYEMGFSAYQVLTVASMIEREAKFDVDRPKIARVIYNRLKFGMPLQIDATLFYGQDPNASFADLKALDTPYNTYLHEGLPPTPIANPGRASIEAALNPSPDPGQGDPICAGLAPGDCHYLFYVKSDKDGHHVFAATNEQHETNVEAAQAAGVLG